MEIGEPDPGVGQPIEIGRINLAAECADIGIPEVVCNDHEEVWPFHAQASCQVHRRDGMLRRTGVIADIVEAVGMSATP
jgi:hypothetical protein